MGEHVGAKAVQDDVEQVHHQQAEGEDVEGGEAPVHQHFVDHHLEEKRGDQGKELNEERCQQDLAQQLFVFEDGGDEPGEVEAAKLLGKTGALCDQHEPARPAGFEIGAREDRGLFQQRIVDEHLFVRDLRQDDEVAVGGLGDGRQPDLIEPRPI